MIYAGVTVLRRPLGAVQVSTPGPVCSSAQPPGLFHLVMAPAQGVENAITTHTATTRAERVNRSRGSRAVIYVREPLDNWGDARAVERFEEQCRWLCDARGLSVIRVLRDND